MSGKKGGKRDDSYFAAGRRKRNKALMIAIPVAAAVIIGAVAAGLFYAGQNPYVLGSTHQHAVFAVKLDGQAIDFSQDKYQVASRYIHVENGDGTTLHLHANGVPFNEFLKSVNMKMENGCFTRDDGAQFCENEEKNLRSFVNSEEIESMSSYVLKDDDRMLVIYGNEDDAAIQSEIDALKNTPVKK